MTAKDILLGAADLVGKGWVKGAYATDAKGKTTDIDRPEAINFCAVGAMRRATLDLGIDDGVAYSAARLVAHKVVCTRQSEDGIAYGTIAEYNDSVGRTQADIVALFKEAAEKVGDSKE